MALYTKFQLRSYTETKKFTDGRTDGRTDAEGYNIIRPFFKRAYKKTKQDYEHIS